MNIRKVAWICLDQQKVLTARSKGKDAFFIPGGKIEPGESEQDAVVREIKEELAVDLDPNSLTLFDRFEAQAHGKPEGVMVQIACYFGAHTGTPQPTTEIEELAWLGSADKDRAALVVHKILDALKDRGMVA